MYEPYLHMGSYYHRRGETKLHFEEYNDANPIYGLHIGNQKYVL
jgi:hypothetical protein